MNTESDITLQPVIGNIRIVIGKRRRDGKYPVKTIFPSGKTLESIAPSYCAAMAIYERYEKGE